MSTWNYNIPTSKEMLEEDQIKRETENISSLVRRPSKTQSSGASAGFNNYFDYVDKKLEALRKEAPHNYKKTEEGREIVNRFTKENKDTISENFIDKLINSESGGKSDAKITDDKGRIYVGLLQFGQARLADHKRATGMKYTQEEFQQNVDLQNQVAAWHFKDIDKAINKLGDIANNFDRDGLRAVAHLGGIGGLKKFVKTGGEHNVADFLGTSLQHYYKKFSAIS